jgi:hypothetical protein
VIRTRFTELLGLEHPVVARSSRRQRRAVVKKVNQRIANGRSRRRSSVGSHVRDSSPHRLRKAGFLVSFPSC